jgi:hypothetical protein
MTSYVTPKKNVAFIIYLALPSQADGRLMQTNPTLAAGDAKVSIDGGALTNLTTLPAVTPGSSKMVKVSLSSSEMNGDNITIVFSDAAGAEWCDVVVNIQTSARQIDDLATQTSVDTVDDFLDTEIAAIKAKTDNLPSDPADASDIAAAFAVTNGKIDVVDDFLDTEIAAIKTQTDKLTFTVANQLDVNVLDWKSATAPAMTGDAFARLGAPAGASVSADVAAVKADTGSIKVKTDSLTFSVAGMADVNVVDWKGSTAAAMTGDAFARVGAPAGASVSADIAAINAKTTNLPSSPAAVGSAMTLTSGERTAIANEVEAQIIDETDSEKVLTAITDKIAAVNPDLAGLTVSAIAAGVRVNLATELGRIDATVSSRSSHSAGDVWAVGTRRLSDGTNIVLAKGVGVTGFNDLSAAQVNAEADTALADYDGPTHAELTAELATSDDAVLAQVALVKSKTDNLPSDPADAGVMAGLIAGVEAKVDIVDTVVDAVLVDTAEIGAAGAGLSAVPWNAAWDAEVQSEAADALAAYDPPTHAELTGGLAGADDAVLAAIAALTIPSASANAAAVLEAAFEGAETVQDFLRLSRAVLYGESDGQGTTTVHYRNLSDSKNRIIGTIDDDGNRTAVTLDAT